MRAVWQVALVAALVVTLLAGMAVAISVPPKSPPPRPTPVPAALAALLRSATVGEPWQSGAVTVFPVEVKATRSPSLLTLDEAAARKTLAVSEAGDGDVNRVVARNGSDQRVFLMAGETLTGAKQDRMVAGDILLPPRSRTEVAVWCVEESRWSGGKEFRSGGFAAPAAVRQRGAHTTQSEVWGAVSGARRSVGMGGRGSLAMVARSKQVQDKIRPHRERLLPLPKRHLRVSGVIVAYGREWLAADVFSDPALFRRLWPKLLDSYLMDAVTRPAATGRPSQKDAEQFVGQVFWTEPIATATSGLGRRTKLRGDTVCGSALVLDAAVVHLEVFPALREPTDPEPLSRPRVRY